MPVLMLLMFTILTSGQSVTSSVATVSK